MRVLSEWIEEIRSMISQKRTDTSDPYNSDAEILVMMERHFRALYYKLVQKAENYFEEELVYPKVQSGADIKLPDDFYKITSLYNLRDNKHRVNVYPTDRVSSGRYEFSQAGFPNINYGLRHNQYRYLLLVDSIRIFPNDRSVEDFELVYVKDAPRMKEVFKEDAADDTTKTRVLKIPNGFYDYITYQACVDALMSRDDETMDWKNRADKIMADVDYWSEDRKSNFPDRIKMVDGEDALYADDNYLY